MSFFRVKAAALEDCSVFETYDFGSISQKQLYITLLAIRRYQLEDGIQM